MASAKQKKAKARAKNFQRTGKTATGAMTGTPTGGGAEQSQASQPRTSGGNANVGGRRLSQSIKAKYSNRGAKELEGPTLPGQGPLTTGNAGQFQGGPGGG